MKLSAMPPPHASSGETIQCVECGSMNPARRKFCGKCGSHLWDPCLRCSETNPAQEEFCGNCGVSLQDSLREKAFQLDETIARAKTLFEECRFLDAIGLLTPLEAVTHPRLLAAAARAKELLLQCSRERICWSARVREIEEEVLQCKSPDQLDSALRRIREIPENLRSRELRDFFADGRNQQAEIAELSQAVALASKQPLTAEIVEKVERLLFLQPQHAEAAKMALAINRSVMRRSKMLALQGNHEKALEILDRVPAAFQDEEFRGLCERLVELAYLAWDVGHAPLVDCALLAFAQRLKKHVPQDSPLQGLCHKLASLEPLFRQSPPADRRWAEAPATPLLGSPTEFLVDLSPIRIESSDQTAALAENPGRFAVACGLALQGLGIAPLQINLLPEETRLGKIGRWLSKRKPSAAWGIEISSSGIKGVKLRAESERVPAATGNEPALVLEECRVVEHRRHLAQTANEKDRDSLLEETLKRFLEQNHLENTSVVVALPDWMVLLKTVELPPMPGNKREPAIAYESRHLFATPLPDVTWKYARLDAAEGAEAEQRPFTAAYVGVRQLLLKEFLKRWAKAGLKIDAVQCDMAALYNFAVFHATAEKTDGLTVFVDLGANRLNVLACSPQRIWHRSVMFGSDQINKALIREFNLTFSQAEQWKRDSTLTPSIGKYYEALQSIYDVYVEETLASLAAYQKAFPGDTIGRIIGCGGGFAAHDLPRYFLWRK